MAMDAHDIEKLIKDGIPDAKVTIRDLAGDGDHYAAEVVAESFRGKSRVQQHQMVYDALKGNMGGVLHALAPGHGKVVESGPCEQVFKNPENDYTRDLLAAMPGARWRAGR